MGDSTVLPAAPFALAASRYGDYHVPRCTRLPTVVLPSSLTLPRLNGPAYATTAARASTPPHKHLYNRSSAGTDQRTYYGSSRTRGAVRRHLRHRDLPFTAMRTRPCDHHTSAAAACRRPAERPAAPATRWFNAFQPLVLRASRDLRSTGAPMYSAYSLARPSPPLTVGMPLDAACGQNVVPARLSTPLAGHHTPPPLYLQPRVCISCPSDIGTR